MGDWERQHAQRSPNAVSVFSKDGSTIRGTVVVLKTRICGDQLTFVLMHSGGRLGGRRRAASVFIDIIGMPWTPLSFAGVARRCRGSLRLVWSSRPYHHPYYPPPTPYYALMRVLPLPALLLNMAETAMSNAAGTM
jgi:hypothetical protein